MTFNASAMYPGLTVSAPFIVRAKTGSLGGTVTLALHSSSGSTALLSAVNYKVFTDTVAGCTTSSTPSSSGAWLAGSASAWVTGITTAIPANSRTLPSGTSTTPGAAVHYCVIAQLSTSAPNSVQGASASATWAVTGSTAG